MKRFEEIDHTADWAFRAYGRDLKELFQNAAYAIFELQGAHDVPAARTRHLRVQGVDREAVLVNWLSELLFLQETQREAYGQFQITKLTDTELEADVIGGPAAPPSKYIKAVTYHDLKIEQTPGGWQATIVVDV